MAKDLKNVIKIMNGDMQLESDSLDQGKTVEMAVEKGELVTKSLETGYVDYFKAHVELVSDTAPEGSVCGCGKPADIVIRMWR